MLLMLKTKLSLLGRIRLLPIVALVGLLMFGLKVGDLWDHSPLKFGGVKPAGAQQQTDETPTSEAANGDAETDGEQQPPAEGDATAAAPDSEEGEVDNSAPLPDASDFHAGGT